VRGRAVEVRAASEAGKKQSEDESGDYKRGRAVTAAVAASRRLALADG